MHKSLFWPAIWAVALRLATGALDRNSRANHIGCIWEIVTRKLALSEPQSTPTVVSFCPLTYPCVAATALACFVAVSFGQVFTPAAPAAEYAAWSAAA